MGEGFSGLALRSTKVGISASGLVGLGLSWYIRFSVEVLAHSGTFVIQIVSVAA